MVDETLLCQLNQFTRRELSEDEVYIFDVILCDNDIDRQNEAFSDHALDTLKTLFVGKTGIFDHNAKGSNQTARIFSTEVVSESGKTNKMGKPYKFLKGNAYMVKTSSNQDLIKEIDGGIKKEVSVSCTAKSKRCSICGKDVYSGKCTHTMGNQYMGKPCYTILDDISDAYEWSFVAVPAQVNAGVTKHYVVDTSTPPQDFPIDEVRKSLIGDIVRLNFLNGSDDLSKAIINSFDSLELNKLLEIKDNLSKSFGSIKEATPQLKTTTSSSKQSKNFSHFKV